MTSYSRVESEGKNDRERESKTRHLYLNVPQYWRCFACHRMISDKNVLFCCINFHRKYLITDSDVFAFNLEMVFVE